MKKTAGILIGIALLVAIVFYSLYPTSDDENTSLSSDDVVVNIQEMPDTEEEEAAPARAVTQKPIVKKTSPKMASSSNDPEEKQKVSLIENYVTISGVAEEFSSLDDMISMQIDQIRKLDISEEDKQQFEDTLRQIFNSKKMQEDYMNDLKEQMTLAELQSLTEMYNDPLMIREADANAHIKTEEGQREFGEFLKQKDEISEDRLKLVRELDEKTHTSENAYNMINQMMGIMREGMGSVEGISSDEDKARDKAFKSFSAQMKENLKKGVEYNFLFANRNTSNSDLTKVISMHGSPAKQKESRIKENNSSRTITAPANKEALSRLMKKLSKDPKAQMQK